MSGKNVSFAIISPYMHDAHLLSMIQIRVRKIDLFPEAELSSRLLIPNILFENRFHPNLKTDMLINCTQKFRLKK